MTQILLRYSKDRSCNKLASLSDPGLELGIFKGFKEDPCEIFYLNSRITYKNISITQKRLNKIFIEILLDLCDNSFFNTF